VSFQTLLGNGYVNNAPATAQLSRFNDFASDVANQANLDTQFEYRFTTGVVQHKALVGIDLRATRSPTGRRSTLRRRRSICSIRSTASTGFSRTVFANQTITQSRPAFMRRISSSSAA